MGDEIRPCISKEILMRGLQYEFFLTLDRAVDPDAVKYNVNDDQVARAMEAARKAAREVAKELES